MFQKFTKPKKMYFENCPMVLLPILTKFQHAPAYLMIQKFCKMDKLSNVIANRYDYIRGWSGGVMVLGKLPVPGRPTNLDKSRASAFCAFSRCGWGCLDIFSLVYHFSFFLPLSGRRPDID